MANILLVYETKNFIIAALESQLESQNHRVIHTGGFEQAEEAFEQFDLFLIYAEENLGVRKKRLMSLKEKSLEENTPIIVMGDYDCVMDVIPLQFVWKHMQHPINVKQVMVEVENCLKHAGEKDYKKQILVVDDSGAALRNVKGWLEGKYYVSLANSATMAIKYLALNRPDLILLDYEMPICDGKQVLEMIRSERDFADIPVIFLTGRNDRETVMNVTGLHPEGYLLKSMEPEVIVQKIDEFFARKGK